MKTLLKNLLLLTLLTSLIACSKNNDGAGFEDASTTNASASGDQTPGANSGNNNSGNNNSGNGDQEPISDLAPFLDTSIPNVAAGENGVVGAAAMVGRNSKFFAHQDELKRRFDLDLEKVNKMNPKKRSMGVLSHTDGKMMICRAFNTHLDKANVSIYDLENSRQVFKALKKVPMYNATRASEVEEVFLLSPNVYANPDMKLKGIIVAVEENSGDLGLRLLAIPPKKVTDKTRERFKRKFARSFFASCVCDANPSLTNCQPK